MDSRKAQKYRHGKTQSQRGSWAFRPQVFLVSRAGIMVDIDEQCWIQPRKDYYLKRRNGTCLLLRYLGSIGHVDIKNFPQRSSFRILSRGIAVTAS